MPRLLIFGGHFDYTLSPGYTLVSKDIYYNNLMYYRFTRHYAMVMVNACNVNDLYHTKDISTVAQFYCAWGRTFFPA